jgi:hypothetical protein
LNTSFRPPGFMNALSKSPVAASKATAAQNIRFAPRSKLKCLYWYNLTSDSPIVVHRFAGYSGHLSCARLSGLPEQICDHFGANRAGVRSELIKPTALRSY